MLRSLLQTNNLLSFFIVGLLCIALFIPSFWLDQELINLDHSLFNDGTAQAIGQLPPFFTNSLVMALIIASALVIQSAINRSDIRSSMTLEPFFWYAGLNALMALSHRPLPLLIANFLFALAFRRMMMLSAKKSNYSIVFDAGLFIGLATLFNPFYVMLLIALWVAISNFSSLSWREVMFSIIGLLFPFYIIISLRYLMGIPIQEFFDSMRVLADGHREVDLITISYIAVTIVLIGVALFRNIKNLSGLNIDQRKVIRLGAIILMLCIFIALANHVVGYRGMIISTFALPFTLFLVGMYDSKDGHRIPDILTLSWLVLSIVTVIGIVVKN